MFEAKTQNTMIVKSAAVYLDAFEYTHISNHFESMQTGREV